MDLNSGRYGDAMDMFAVEDPYSVCWTIAVKSASVNTAAAAM